MPFHRDTFDRAVWKVVVAIESGRVMSYGEVARVAGFPRHARMVGRSMGRSPAPLPWHRVVRSDRTLAFAIGSERYNRQKELLAEEGVPVVDGRVIARPSESLADLDKLLWGPGDEL